jgi:ABC-type multidrug transport system fused ATPase/permease subunit
MNEGQIEEQGTHEELMDLGGEYFKLYKHQTAVTER